MGLGALECFFLDVWVFLAVTQYDDQSPITQTLEIFKTVSSYSSISCWILTLFGGENHEINFLTIYELSPNTRP